GNGFRGHARALNVGYKIIKRHSKNVGLRCIIQELVNWRNPENFLTDCFSTFVKYGSSRTGYKVFRNSKFMDHTKLVKIFSNYYK
ncbi:MAG: hypothetical protein Q8Q33_05210, partial [Chlamydiota bacterium]|nr:hypothetical protein [Chlamydiota bacterium]